MATDVAVLPSHRARRLGRSPWARRVVSLLGALVVWQVVVWMNQVIHFMNPVLLPTPAGVLRGASEQIAEGVLHLDVMYSLYRVITGFLLGAVLAILVGCAAGSVR
jgi:NitT/TauT family transport system permease protein